MPLVPNPKAPRSGRHPTILIALVAAGAVAAGLIVGSVLLTRDDTPGSSAVSTPVTTADTETTTVEETATGPVALVAGIPQKGSILGRSSARVTMKQFEDLQCPYCRDYTLNALPSIIEEYVRTGRVRLDFRGIAFLGPDSDTLLRATVAAGRQNKLWEVVGLLYENQGAENSGWATPAVVDGILRQVPGLDVARVKKEARSASVEKEIAAMAADAEALQVPGTPAFYITVGINKPYRVQVALTPEEFRPALDDALKP